MIFMFKDMSGKTNNSMPYIKDSFLQIYYFGRQNL